MFPLPPLTDEQRPVVERVATLSRERFARARGPIRRRLHLPLRELRRPARGRPVRAHRPARVRRGRRRPGDLRARPPRDRQGLLGHRADLQHALDGDHLRGRARHRGAEAALLRRGGRPGRPHRVHHQRAGAELPRQVRAQHRVPPHRRRRLPGGRARQFAPSGTRPTTSSSPASWRARPRARRGDLGHDPEPRRGGEDRGHLERHRHARHHQPHHPLRLRGRSGQRGRAARPVPHHRPAGLRARLRRGLPGYRRGRLRVHGRDGAHQDPAPLDRAAEPSSARAATRWPRWAPRSARRGSSCTRPPA